MIFLDHDDPGNPASVRRFHDELVAIDDGLYLATSHYRTGERLRSCAISPGQVLRGIATRRSVTIVHQHRCVLTASEFGCHNHARARFDQARLRRVGGGDIGVER